MKRPLSIPVLSATIIALSLACADATETAPITQPAPVPAAPAAPPEPKSPLRKGDRYYFDHEADAALVPDFSQIVLFKKDGTCVIADYESTYRCTYKEISTNSPWTLEITAFTGAFGPDGPHDVGREPGEQYVVADDGQTITSKGKNGSVSVNYALITDDHNAGGIIIKGGKSKGGKGKGVRDP